MCENLEYILFTRRYMIEKMMITCRKVFRCLLVFSIFVVTCQNVFAQADTIPFKETIVHDSTILIRFSNDTIQRKSLDEYLKTRKGFIGKMFKGLTRDTTDVERANNLQRSDERYSSYQGLVIRHIYIKDLRFGVPLNDTLKRINNFFTRVANTVHHATRLNTIRNNLFFRENSLVIPHLLADNETYLRQLPYVQDVNIEVIPLGEEGGDSVDVYVILKDKFSLGISVASVDLRNTDVKIQEDNIYGSGNAVAINGLYDMSRRKNFGFGGDYLIRNIGHSFVSFNAGYQSYNPSLIGLKEENYYYVKFNKPLINRYKRWVYEFDVSYHSTRNMYSGDSLYLADQRYRYSNIDAWLGYNIKSGKVITPVANKKLRALIALRFLDQKFWLIPSIYKNNYYWKYATIKGGMAAVSFYRQNIYKSQFVYAFGVNEDIPVGLNLTFTGGYVRKENLERPFVSFNYQQSFFTKKNNYFNYIIRAEGYLDHNTIEDINMLGTLNYFDHLKALGPRWKQRTFVNVSITKQINTILNEPLYIDSKFALPEFRNGDEGGSLRVTARVESDFYSPWSIASFRFAPFVFAYSGLFTPYHTSTSNIYTIVGAGIRIRNESLIFGSLELRGYYFLKKNVYDENWKFDINSNVTFRYNTQLANKPDFIQVN